MEAGVFDVLFLSETWYQRNSNYMSHPFSFQQTQKIVTGEPVITRASGGLLAMLSPTIRTLVRSSRLLPNAIWLDIDGLKVLGVYIPPSQYNSSGGPSTDSFPYHDILLGDINVRFRGVSRKKNSLSPLPIQDFWYKYMRERSMAMCRPHLGPSPFQLLPNCELDHVFHTTSITPELTLIGSEQFGIKTVHKYILHCTVEHDATFESDTRAGLGRYHLEKLETNGVISSLQSSWESRQSDLDWDTDQVDRYDEILTQAVQDVAERVLGIYDVLSRKTAPDRAAAYISSHTSALAAIRLFKRKQRMNSSNSLIVAKSPTGNPLEECRQKYKDLFHCPAEGYSYDDPSPSTDDALIRHLSDLVTPSKISKFIEQYPKHKACGLDGIHSLLIQALLPTTFLDRLFRLFVLCILSGKVPQRWNQSVIFLLPKTQTPPITCDSVRPLSILPMFRRLFESLILPAFTDPERDYCTLHPSQAGFRRGYSTLTQAAICHQINLDSYFPRLQSRL